MGAGPIAFLTTILSMGTIHPGRSFRSGWVFQQPIMRNPVVRWVVLIVGACVVSVLGAWKLSEYQRYQAHLPRKLTAEEAKRLEESRFVAAAPDTGTSQKQDLFKIIADAPPLPSGQVRPDTLPQIFPAFQHRPFDTAGFDEVMLPFSYSDPDHRGNANEAMALAALISSDLDWSPGCYCARHAYFVFKRDREYVQQFQQGYEPSLVSSFVKRWRATHAVGGQLIRTADGYKGKLQIFDAQGKTVLNQSYDTARSFWDLLGDMDADVMTALDAKPAETMVRYLRQPRCRHFESVVDLGSAAMMEEKSPEEFGVYQKILENDPGFSMVRHWWANQKHWQDFDDAAWEQQNGQALASRIEIASIEEFTAAKCPDSSLADRLPDWLDEAELIAGTDLPHVLCSRLRNDIHGRRSRKQVFDDAVRVSAKYPNSHELMVELGNRSQDRLLGASLLTASLFDHYQPGIGTKLDELYDLAWVCDVMGRDDLTQELISLLGPQQSKVHLDLLLQSLCKAGHYADAADLYPMLDLEHSNPATREEMAPYAFFAAFMTDRGQLLEQVYHDQADVLERLRLTGVFDNYIQGFKGKMHDLNVVTNYVDYAGMWNLFLVASSDAGHGVSTYHHLMSHAMFHFPMNRLVWIVQDNYQRRDPSIDAGAFYEFLEMLFSYDPWVNQAVADYHKRGGVEQPIDPEMLRADLLERQTAGLYPIDMNSVNWQHAVTAWRVAACVDQLLKQHKPHDAAEIARLYRIFADGNRNTWQITIAGELERRANAGK